MKIGIVFDGSTTTQNSKIEWASLENIRQVHDVVVGLYLFALVSFAMSLLTLDITTGGFRYVMTFWPLVGIFIGGFMKHADANNYKAGLTSFYLFTAVFVGLFIGILTWLWITFDLFISCVFGSSLICTSGVVGDINAEYWWFYISYTLQLIFLGVEIVVFWLFRRRILRFPNLANVAWVDYLQVRGKYVKAIGDNADGDPLKPKPEDPKKYATWDDIHSKRVVNDVMVFLFLIIVFSYCLSLLSLSIPIGSTHFYFLLIPTLSILISALMKHADAHNAVKAWVNVYYVVIIIYGAVLLAWWVWLLVDLITECLNGASLICTTGVPGQVLGFYWWMFFSWIIQWIILLIQLLLFFRMQSDINSFFEGGEESWEGYLKDPGAYIHAIGEQWKQK